MYDGGCEGIGPTCTATEKKEEAMTATPSWYTDLEADEASIDARINHRRHALSGVAHADCRECVPAVLIAETPERFDPPCGADS